MSEALRVALYRFRTTFGRRWGNYLSMVVLIGLIGGIAMASIAAGRRTQSSYPTFLASTNPSDMTMTVYNSATGGPGPALTATITRLADVERVETLVAPTVAPLAPNGAPRLNALADVDIGGSLDGVFFEQDRLTVVEGRRANPRRADEVMMTARAAQLLGEHVGHVVPLGLYTDTQTSQPGFGTPRVAPRLRVRAVLVGIVVANNQVVEDDVDAAYGLVVLTPALIREAIASAAPARVTPIVYDLQLDHGNRDVPGLSRSSSASCPGALPMSSM